jgi:hypothetical protein
MLKKTGNSYQNREKYALSPEFLKQSRSSNSLNRIYDQCYEDLKSQIIQLKDNTGGENCNEWRCEIIYPLSLVRLEMFEAELCNQNILPPMSELSWSLAKHCYLEANKYHWHARRFGYKSGRLRVLIDVPSYVIHKSEQLIYSYNRHLNDNLYAYDFSLALAMCQCFERYAYYLNGAYKKSTNRFQSGLNLILRTLSLTDNKTKIKGGQAIINDSILDICLPMSVSELRKIVTSIQKNS